MRIQMLKKIRKHYSYTAFFLGIAMLLAYIPDAPSASAACSYPAQVLDLANWKETLPTGSSSSPTEIKQTSLTTFSVSPYFLPNATCNGVIFRAPVNGVTTSGSGYPRSELREMANNGTTNASWATNSGAHSMFIAEAITAVPKTKKHVVAGQIHDANDDVIVIRLEYPKLFVDINGQTGPTLDANYTLGKKFTVQFIAANGQIKIYYNGNPTAAYTLSKSGSGNYFKAGAYTQSNCSKESDCSSSNYGEVVIYNLQLKHQSASSGITLISSTEPTPTPTPTPAPIPAPIQNISPDNGTTFETESGLVTSPMKLVVDASASGGQYAVQTTDTGKGTLKYTIAIKNAGKYKLRAKVISPNGSSNSVYYALDSNALRTWDFPNNIQTWTWADGPELILSEGPHTLTIQKREKNTRLDAFEIRPVDILSSIGGFNGVAPFEAEMGKISGGMQILSDSIASGGQFIEAASSGTAEYNVNVPESGNYRVAGWIKAPAGFSDSFYVAVDSSSKNTWTLASPTNDWTYDVDDNHIFPLSAGTHTLLLSYREAGAKIDKLVLVRQ